MTRAKARARVLSGVLGEGKTTLLNRVLEAPGSVGGVVPVTGFGAAGAACPDAARG